MFDVGFLLRVGVKWKGIRGLCGGGSIGVYLLFFFWLRMIWWLVVLVVCVVVVGV